jgi:hypothetical protein
MNREGQPEFERSSSFARSFFQAGGGAEEGGGGGGGDDGANGQPSPRDGMRRRQSRRRLSRSSSGHNSDDGPNAGAAAAGAAMVGEDEPTGNLPHLGEASASKDRQGSWYTDALLQGGEDMAAILGHVQNSSQEENHLADDDQVLEQYRIMAHVEASMRVQENTGFDMAEYEKRRKLHPDSGQKGEYSKKPKPRLPEPRKVTSSSRSQMKPEEPPLPPPRANRRFLEQRTPRVPELCTGNLVRGTANLPAGEHVVRCLGCRTQLRVNLLANLVSCPDCHTVSPASSTRR